MGTVFVVRLGKMKLERTLLALTLLALSAHTGLGRQVLPALPKQTGQGRIVGGTEAEDGASSSTRTRERKNAEMFRRSLFIPTTLVPICPTISVCCSWLPHLR